MVKREDLLRNRSSDSDGVVISGFTVMDFPPLPSFPSSRCLTLLSGTWRSHCMECHVEGEGTAVTLCRRWSASEDAVDRRKSPGVLRMGAAPCPVDSGVLLG